ncbi:GNAT family N-acetyltransferase [Anaerobacillus alkaliphilus]|nr:GNAT family N-acetyltransferase [Anaerobacillus alkaliphilus]
MNIRKLSKDEMDYSISMSEFAFQLELTDEQRQQRKDMMNPEETWVAVENDEIISKVTTLPFKTYIQGKEFLMGGVSGVVTWPENRRGGLVKTLLKKSLEEMKEKEQTISFLFPFSIPFYRKYGWELFTDKKLVTVKKDQFPRFPKRTGTIRRVSKDYELLSSIYEKFAPRFNGMLVRDKKWWNGRLFANMKGQMAVYYDEQGEAQGYLAYDVKHRVMKVHELVYLNTDAWKSLWHFISDHDSMIETVEYKTSANDPALFFISNPLVEQKVEAYFMARIVDVKPFLSQYPFHLAEGETVVLHVEDEFCEWNNGTYFITNREVKFFEQAKEGASCTHPPKRGVTCTVQHLTAMLLNYQKPTTLLYFDAISGSENEIKLLEKVIPAREPAFYDFF